MSTAEYRHTPGPWYQSLSPEPELVQIVARDPQNPSFLVQVATFRHRPDCGEAEGKANALLMVHSSEMLDALDAARRFWTLKRQDPKSDKVAEAEKKMVELGESVLAKVLA
ncbi:hypothetical protein [Desulfovibrio ferrophilus]|uniref:Uncharacterized protein n=1 Tax=Desulfovibrio ferrophilus TaxID=241368 RepID=A0A2Z6B3W2_9BACT|nr:hypothetical protein [Desulfovibrio ferrophilus]BBD10110.1 uncharacterized protein DFE_A0009 [Desulfovibrio ferrophilus]